MPVVIYNVLYLISKQFLSLAPLDYQQNCYLHEHLIGKCMYLNYQTFDYENLASKCFLRDPSDGYCVFRRSTLF